MLQCGLEHLRAGEIDQAGVCFERAYRLAPQRPEVCYALGRERMRQGQAHAALELLRAAWNGDRSLVSAAGSLARCLGLSLQRFDEAHAVLDDAARDSDNDPLLDVIRGELFLEQDQIEAAERHADKVLTDPEAGELARSAANAVLARVYNRRGLDAVAAGDNHQALFLFKRAADRDPRWSGPHVNMGAVFADLGNRERALRAYRHAALLEPNNAMAHLDHGLLLHEMGDLAAARSAFERAVECDPTATGPIVALARAHVESGAVDLAVELLIRSVEAKPSSSALWTQLGVALSALDAVDDAEASWRRALDLDPENSEACLRLADVLTRQGRYQEAALLAERARSHGTGNHGTGEKRIGSLGAATENRVGRPPPGKRPRA